MIDVRSGVSLIRVKGAELIHGTTATDGLRDGATGGA